MMNNQEPLARDKQLHGSLHTACRTTCLSQEYTCTHYPYGVALCVYLIFTPLCFTSLYIDMCSSWLENLSNIAKVLQPTINICQG